MKLFTFTWNMQRGRSMVDHPEARGGAQARGDARYTVLMELCMSHGVGFIQEAGTDLHGTIRSGGDGPLPLGRGFWRASMRADYQAGASPCRGALFCQEGHMRTISIDQMSGGWDAERYPAAAIAELGRFRVLLCSFHATSGDNARENCIAFLNHIDRYADAAAVPIDAVLVGGDFNTEMFPGVGYPLGPTHQRGKCLDGFYTYKPKASGAKRVALRQVRTHVRPKWRELRLTSETNTPGYFANALLGGKLVKVSDHAPVMAEFEVV